MVIQRLLREAGRDDVADDLVSVAPEGLEAQADWTNLESPETYLGYEQGRTSRPPAVPRSTSPAAMSRRSRLKLNHWALSGNWTIESRASVLNAAGGRIAVPLPCPRRPPRHGTACARRSVPFRVLVDGEPPGDAHGLDVDEQGHGTLAQQRLHQLIREPGSIADRTFEITFLAPGVEAYVFTFG